MHTTICNIIKKKRPIANGFAGPENFICSEGKKIDPDIIAKNPNISLYCIDHQNSQAIFLETPKEVDLVSSPFLYETQYESSLRLFRVPYFVFHKLAEEKYKPKVNLVMIYSVPRSGSTLLSKIFNCPGYSVSLSEPDIFSQLADMRSPDICNDQELSELIKSSVRIIVGSFAKQEKVNTLFIKPRSYGIELGDLIYDAFPDSKAIFSYRNADDAVISSVRAISGITSYYSKERGFFDRMIPLTSEYSDCIDFDDPHTIVLHTLSWLSVMDRYFKLYRNNLPILAIRYEDLIKDPEYMAKQLFKYCALPVFLAGNIYKVLGEDSQKGSELSQEKVAKNNSNMPDHSEIRKRAGILLKRHPHIRKPDFVAPGTICSSLGSDNE